MDLKLVLLGNSHVGKTSVFNRYVYGEFTHTSETIGAYFGMREIPMKDVTCNLAIWDTAGEEKFDSLTNFYCRFARAALIVYDVTSVASFNNLDRWVEKVNSEAEKGCAYILVGNKLDLVESNPALRQVPRATAERFAVSVGAMFMEVSAKTGTSVNHVFESVVQRAFVLQADSIYRSRTVSGLPPEVQQPESGKCFCE